MRYICQEEVSWYSVAQLCLTLCDPMDCSMPGFLYFTISRSLLKLMSIESVMPLNHLVLLSPSPLAFSLSQHQGLFQWVSQFFASGGQSIEVFQSISVSASVLPVNIQDWLVWFPCSPRDSQESSPTPQFKSISSSTLSFLYSPTLTSIHDYQENHSFN